ncbi:hypothetical protein HID58_060718, partial [Brassica napus]
YFLFDIKLSNRTRGLTRSNLKKTNCGKSSCSRFVVSGHRDSSWQLQIRLFATELLYLYASHLKSSLFTLTSWMSLTHGDLANPNNRLLSLRNACRKAPSFTRTKALHALSITLWYTLYQPVYICNNVISLYVELGEISRAAKMFDRMPERNTASFNTVISGFSKSGHAEKAWRVFSDMREFGFSPRECLSESSFLGVLSSVSCENDLETSKQLHCSAIKRGLDCDTHVVNSLISAYGRCGNTNMVERVFEKAVSWDIVSWNAIIGATAKGESPLKALRLFVSMQEHEFSPNQGTYVSILSAASRTQTLSFGHQIHGTLIKNGCETDTYLGNALIDFYGKCGSLEDSRLCFDSIPHKNIVCWNTLLWGYANKDDPVVELFKHILQANIRPDNFTYVSILSISSKSCDLALGSSIHGLITKTDFNRADTFVCNVLIDMYGKCGSVTCAVRVFEETREKNVITWTALISSLGIHGYGHEALEKFKEMVSLGFKPDRVSFISMLSACRHSGMAKEGMELFWKMRDYGVEPDMDLYCCAVDLLARNGLRLDGDFGVVAAGESGPGGGGGGMIGGMVPLPKRERFRDNVVVLMSE